MTTLWKTVASESGQSELIPVNSKFKEVTKPNAASPNKGTYCKFSNRGAGGGSKVYYGL